MKYFLLLVFAFLGTGSFAQSTFAGKVISEGTKSPVSYANIGIANKNFGTLSNADGTFLIRVPSVYANDTLQFSAIGFSKRSIPINSLSKQKENIITLMERPIQLEPITVSQKKEKNRTFELGNSSVSGGVLETDTAYAGRSIALLIDNRAPAHHEDLVFPIYFQKAKLRIFKNNLQTLKFRIRINTVDAQTGEPSDDILRQSIVVESGMRKGWLEFDLAEFDLILSAPFFVTFEQILDANDRSSIALGFREFLTEHPDKIKVDTIDFEGKKVVHEFAGAVALDLPGTFIAISRKAADSFTCFERDTSFGNWKKVQGIVTATVTLSNQKPSQNSKIKQK